MAADGVTHPAGLLTGRSGSGTGEFQGAGNGLAAPPASRRAPRLPQPLPGRERGRGDRTLRRRLPAWRNRGRARRQAGRVGRGSAAAAARGPAQVGSTAARSRLGQAPAARRRGPAQRVAALPLARSVSLSVCAPGAGAVQCGRKSPVACRVTGRCQGASAV